MKKNLQGPFVPVKVDSPFKVLLRAQVFQNSQDPPGNCYSWDAFLASNKPEDVIVDALRSLVKGPNGATSTDLFDIFDDRILDMLSNVKYGETLTREE